jgi:hypothetical protein
MPLLMDVCANFGERRREKVFLLATFGSLLAAYIAHRMAGDTCTWFFVAAAAAYFCRGLQGIKSRLRRLATNLIIASLLWGCHAPFLWRSA